MKSVISCFHKFFQTVIQNLWQFISSNKSIQTCHKYAWNVNLFAQLSPLLFAMKVGYFVCYFDVQYLVIYFLFSSLLLLELLLLVKFEVNYI